jgi:DNA-binding NarL/FixJ family response regulator
MILPREVVVVSASPILSSALRRLVENELQDVRCRTLCDPETPAVDGAAPDILLFAPQSWEEAAAWLARLRRRYAACPWLMLAEPRLAGMFLSHLESHLCALVPSSATTETLRHALLGQGHRCASRITEELQARFAYGTALTAARWRLPTPMELQCGCAVSLGLTNRQITGLLHVGEATVKSHVHRLLQKLQLAGRVELGAFVQQALGSSAPPFG